jgi:DNA-binding transcriptional LysR family regulator
MISLVHLKYFRDAALLGGIGPAAKRNFVSPSAVSQAIKSLESYLEAELLEHAKNQFFLTAQGKVLLEHCHSVFAAAENMQDEIKSSQGSTKGDVVFATQQSIAHFVMPDFIARMSTDYPDIKPKISLATTDIVHNWVMDRTIDFGISVDNFGEHNLMAIPLYRGSFVFIEGLELPKKQNKNRGFVLPGETTRESKAFKSNFEKQFKQAPNVLLEIGSWGVIKRLAETGFGVGLVPDYLVRFDRNKTVREVKMDLPQVTYEINAYYCRKRQKLTRQSQVFLEELESFMAQLKH